MSNKILVTDTLFIFDEHIKKLKDAGYEIERLPKPNASEAELVKAVKGKVGYILGGIEQVTDKVIDEADELKAIAFTGTSWKYFIPSWQKATKKGIALANAPHANANAVAEWHFASAMAMVRNLFALGRTGDKTFQTTSSISDMKVGIIGLGHIGNRLAELFTAVGAKEVSYWSLHDKISKFQKKEIDEILSTSNIVCFCTSGEAGKSWVDKYKLAKVKDGAIVTVLSDETLNEEDLLAELKKGRLRAFLDWTPNHGYKELSLETFYSSNETAAYNTHAANKLGSDWATDSIINMLKTGKDKYKVN